MALKDTLAERLRRRPAKPMGSPRVGSNPTGAALNLQAGHELRIPNTPDAKPKQALQGKKMFGEVVEAERKRLAPP